MTAIWEHKGDVENTSRRRQVFRTFLEYFQMSGVFYHSVIHGLGFFICFMIQILHSQNNKMSWFFSVLYSDLKHWVFEQSECVQEPIYIIKQIILNILIIKIFFSKVTLSASNTESESGLKRKLCLLAKASRFCNWALFALLNAPAIPAIVQLWILYILWSVDRSLLYLSYFSPLVVARQLDKHTIGYITYRAGMQSSMTTTLIRETENSKAVITIQVLISSSCMSPWCVKLHRLIYTGENKGMPSKFCFNCWISISWCWIYFNTSYFSRWIAFYLAFLSHLLTQFQAIFDYELNFRVFFKAIHRLWGLFCPPGLTIFRNCFFGRSSFQNVLPPCENQLPSSWK